MANAAFSTAVLFGFALLLPLSNSQAQGLSASAPTKEFIYFNNRLIAVEQRGPAGSPNAVRAKSAGKAGETAGAAAAGSASPNPPAAQGAPPPTTPPPPLPVPGSSPTFSDSGTRYSASTPAYTHAVYSRPK
jgi:hypothetical protein